MLDNTARTALDLRDISNTFKMNWNKLFSENKRCIPKIELPVTEICDRGETYNRTMA